ncbi:MAG: RrF2 family transcriptional regulator [Planctomycetota bacterium]|jgi:Rrf2 family protein
MLSQTTEYALRAVVFLGMHPDEPCTTQSIAEATKVPAGYLSKVLQSLSREGFLISQRGMGGGFSLSKPASEITILEIINATDTPLRRIESCPLKIGSHTHLCGLHKRLDHAIGLLRDYFADTTIEDVLVEEQNIKPLCETRNSQTLSISAEKPRQRDA